MKRRTFLKRSFLASLGLAAGPEFLLSCKPEDLLPNSAFSGRVLIIGAGAAGLYAGFLLNSRGMDFQILEASGKVGGRLGKRTDFADFPIDLGAQWLHGGRSDLAELARKSGYKFRKDRSDQFFWFRNERVASLPENLGKLMRADASLPDISYADYARQRGLGAEYEYLVEQIAGDFGADASRLSIKWTAVEEDPWSAGRADYKFEETFFDLIDKEFAEPIRDSILLNTPVSRVDYSRDQLVVTDHSGNEHFAEKVIITVPITVLKEGDIEFVPALPSQKTEAFAKIGMDAGMKVFLRFSSKFYEGDLAGGAVCAAYADESEGKTGRDHVLLAFVMGGQAEALSGLGSDAAITHALLGELDLIYGGQASASFLDSHVEDWGRHPFIRGAYSYSSVGIGNARGEAAAPVANKLFFAGEAMSLNGHHQTVHGAVETGLREVLRLLAR